MSIDRRYPIGQFNPPREFDQDTVQSHIKVIAELPKSIEQLIANLPDDWLESHYRKNSWTGRQIVHHLADSHTNAFIRCKLATTENWPEILPYKQTAWAEQIDHSLDVEPSLAILSGIHKRWATLLNDLQTSEWTSTGYFHPEYGRRQPMYEIVALYSWHCRHHLGHLELLNDS
ncbi:MAG: YfiT family bacillithiol transferase [Bacteroidota bacterium]